MQVFALQLLLAVLDGDGLAIRHGLLGVLGKSVKIHVKCLLRAGTPSPASRSSFLFHAP